MGACRLLPVDGSSEGAGDGVWIGRTAWTQPGRGWGCN
jgi:hypothetical protein